MPTGDRDPVVHRRRPVWPEPPALDEAERARLEALAEAQLEERERGAPRRTVRQIVRITLLLTLVLLTLYVLGPGLVEVLSSAPRLREIGWCHQAHNYFPRVWMGGHVCGTLLRVWT